MGGFFKSISQGLVNNGDNVLVNVGEGVRRAPDFVEEMIYTTEDVDTVNDCERFDRNKYRAQLVITSYSIHYPKLYELVSTAISLAVCEPIVLSTSNATLVIVFTASTG